MGLSPDNYDSKSLSDDTSDLSLPDKETLWATAKHPNLAIPVRRSKEALSSYESITVQPERTLYIAAKGIGLLRLPTPSPDLEIPIYYNDGTLAYQSIRGKSCSGNSVLRHPTLGDLVSTTYFFGPNREPIITVLQDPDQRPCAKGTLEIHGKWTSRAVTFSMPDGCLYEWSYAQKRDSQRKKVNLLTLSVKESPRHNDGTAGTVIAQLMRSDEVRTPGSSRCSAGNGGQLVLDKDADRYLDESLIVATCIMMLKKEIDRRRFAQFVSLGMVVT
ncbi:hypothetical protein PV08_07986 [Exophiala spinifera]|uniref:Uncharacterized protein n=1 Tax=Exophiala spinifera TaxID=91928 RepID=A0A0D2BNU9_9EURO|nr:uncharacterized protein PV08_07986 [Exophiala spinifera]KIW12799.1 hypothetical protein PV08_07986 [Exophiala spinifera]